MAGMGSLPPFDAGSAMDRNDVTPGELCARLAQIQCAGEQHCCTTPSPAASCVSDATSECNGMLMLDQIAGDAKVGFNAAAAKTAVTEYERRASMCDPGIAAWAASASGFFGGFDGTLAADADCMAPGGLSASNKDLAVALASCSRAANVACLPAEAGWTCEAPSAVGGVCFSDLNCTAGNYCEKVSLSSYNGVCTARKGAGEVCNSPLVCTSLMCIDEHCAQANDVQAAFCIEE
jgi:hypothetical protein